MSSNFLRWSRSGLSIMAANPTGQRSKPPCGQSSDGAATIRIAAV